MQSQMIGMQNTLDRILAAVQGPQPPMGVMHPPPYPPMRDGPGYVSNLSDTRTPFEGGPSPDDRGQKTFPPLPGFAPPVSLSQLCSNHSLI